MTAKLQHCKGFETNLRKQLKTVKFLQFGETKKGLPFKKYKAQR